jgi:hypothetical protein
MSNPNNTNDHLEEYADGSIKTDDKPVPWELILLYSVLPFWGILWFWLYWNGSWGWLDGGSWEELQKAANTTFPYVNATELVKENQ